MTGSFGSGTLDLISSVVSSSALAVRFWVTAKWLNHSSSREVLTVQAMSSAVSGLPSDHFMSGRSL